MQKTLNFNVPILPSWNFGYGFVELFTSAYVFVDNIEISGVKDYPCPPRKGSAPCHGCGNMRKDKCEHAAMNQVSPYVHMFYTMSGSNSLRRRYDGQPTEMQKRVSNNMVDFLFGFTGYEYRISSDKAAFKDEIIASVNAGKPVIAKINQVNERFHLITGYDGDKLISPVEDYFYKRAYPNGAPVYEDLTELYIFGEKTAPRYKLIDGLRNIEMVMEYDINEKLWDEYLVKMGGWDKFPSDDGLDKADMDEKKARMRIMLDTVRHSMSVHGVIKAFQKVHIRHAEMLNPELFELWETISKTSKYMGHGIENKIDRIKWDTIKPSTFRGISAEICENLLMIKEADIEVLGYINQAIKLIEK